MKYKAQTVNSEHAISLDIADGSTSANIAGRHYEVELRQLTGDEYLLINGTQVYNCRVEGRHGSNNSFTVVLRGISHDITIIDPKRLRSARTITAPRKLFRRCPAR